MKTPLPSPRRLVGLLNIALVAVLIAAALFLARDAVSLALRGPAEEASPEEEALKPLKRQARRNLQDYAPVLEKNVFGFPAGELRALSAEEPRPGPAAPAAPAEITLIGTVAWADGFGYAVVTEDSGEQEVYRTGQYLRNGGVLSKVYPDRILVTSGRGEFEVPIADIATVKEVRPTGRTRTPAKPPQALSGDISEFAKQTSENSFIVDRDAVDAALLNPRQIMTDARLLPNTVEGKQEGFMVKEVRPGGVYAKLGLRNGDVLLRVNEFSISDPETALQVFTALKGMERVELDILRNGSRMTLTYLIR